MSVKRQPSRYAHSAGHTDVCYSENGEKLITCGTDGDIRIWASIDDYDPLQTCVGEWSLCVRQKSDRIQIATDNNSVQLLTFPGGERDSILTRFTAPVNHMAVGRDHNFVAIAAEDMEVKVINLSDRKDNSSHLNFTGLLGPPLSVAMCPRAKLLSVSSGDGFIRFWDVETQKLLKELKCAPKVNSFVNAKLLCRMDFEPNIGTYVAYPDSNAIVILKTSDWSTRYTLNADDVDASFSIVQYSPCGNFIAGASDKGDIVVWELDSQVVVQHTTHPMSIAICAMVWNPAGNGEIAYCDIDGQFGVVTKCNVTQSKQVSEAASEDDITNEVEFEDEDDENVVSIEKLKREIMGSPDVEEIDKASSAPSPRPRTPEVPMQSVFMPSSTPEHLNPRYLCWNHVGVVRCYGSVDDDDDAGKSIEVEFHDSTFHNSMMVQNYFNYTMGSISSTSLALANSLRISVYPLMAGIKEWSLAVEEPINIMCIANSSKLVCFATTNYLVHVCTTYGNQKALFTIPGPVVSMSAYYQSLLIAFHTSSPRKDDQCIQFMFVKLEGRTFQKIDLPNTLGPDCTLSWLGFTDVGSPVAYDSNEMLYVYVLHSNLWVPICDTTIHSKSPSDGFFITAIFETLQTVRGIRCKGSKYPGFTPRPMLSELSFQPPFIEITSEKSQLESNLFMWSTLQVDGVDKKYKECALKTFALACKSNLDQRALELVEMLGNKQIVNLAVKYATKLDKKRLSEKLVDLASQIESGDCDETQFDASIISTPTSVIRPNKKLVLHKSTPKNRISEINQSSSAVISKENLFITKEADTQYTQESTEDIQTMTKDSKENLYDTTFESQEPALSEEVKNPFLKSIKKQPATTSPNPLSLTDKFSGFKAEAKEKPEKITNSSKRKKPETAPEDEKKDKQRKLFQFKFSHNKK